VGATQSLDVAEPHDAEAPSIERRDLGYFEPVSGRHDASTGLSRRWLYRAVSSAMRNQSAERRTDTGSD
jgi:hypothetical protein